MLTKMLMNETRLQGPEDGGEGTGDGSNATPDNSSSSSSEGFDFAELASHDDGAPAPAISSKEAPPASAPGTAPVITTAPTPVPAVPVVTAPAPGVPPAVASPSVAAAQPPAAPVPPTPAAVPATPEVTFEQHRATFIPKLEELYKLSDEEAELARTSPEVALPKLAARLHYEVQMAAFEAITGVLPDMIAQAQEQRQVQTAANDKFYSKWPALKDRVAAEPAVEERIRQAIQATRKVNPNADMDMVINQAGILAMMSLGIPLQQMGGGTAAPTIAPVSRELPARPPGIGATGHVTPLEPSSGQEGSIFESLSEAFLKGEI